MQEIKRTPYLSLEEIRTQYGEEAAALAQTMIKAFGGIGKGKNAPELLNFVADAIESGVIRHDQQSMRFVYRDTQDTEHQLGEENDPLSLVLIEWALALHASVPEAKHVTTTGLMFGFRRLGTGVSSVLRRRASIRTARRIMNKATFGLFSKKSSNS